MPPRSPWRAAVPELPSWDRPGWWSEIAPISLRKFAAAPSFGTCAGRPSLPLPPVVRSVQYRVWGGRDGRPTALKGALEVVGQRGAHVDALGRDRVLEREPLGVQELALEPEHARVAVLRVAG